MKSTSVAPTKNLVGWKPKEVWITQLFWTTRTKREAGTVFFCGIQLVDFSKEVNSSAKYTVNYLYLVILGICMAMHPHSILHNSAYFKNLWMMKLAKDVPLVSIWGPPFTSFNRYFSPPTPAHPTTRLPAQSICIPWRRHQQSVRPM